MVTTEDLLEEGAPDSGDEQMDDPEGVSPDDLDFSQYRPLMVTSYEEAQDDEEEGNFQICSLLAINSSVTIQVAIGEHNLGMVEA
ncbi:uncharacterized protein UBRO_21088 [Ustilago bromivora]|uniref:Uncharacterized protein n=1 Tax=Ustilago bromivora TaxID=307758 RepID=A0A1K0GZC2_9BASI|nr:uncharacterized protein UBRO_21088 [Ustilago bromivora]